MAHYMTLSTGLKESIVMGWNEFSKLGNRKAQDQGQSLVEFALILPVLVLLVFGTIDIGLGFKTYIALTNASREGVRWITLKPSDLAGAQSRIGQEVAHIGLSYSDISTNGNTVTFSPNKSKYTAGEDVKVTIVYQYKLLSGIIPGLPSIKFNATTTMAVLY
jgi:hypothetical protein